MSAKVSDDSYFDLDLLSKIASEFDDSYEAGLKSESSFEFEGSRAVISGVALWSLAGQRVNVINIGRRYRYAYSVEFKDDARNVAFGMAIKTTTGFSLTHASTSKGDPIPLVTAGESRHLMWEFNCNFHPGQYFVNAGVSATDDRGRTHLHRILDVLTFRVQPADEPSVEGGIVYANVEQHFLASGIK